LALFGRRSAQQAVGLVIAGVQKPAHFWTDAPQQAKHHSITSPARNASDKAIVKSRPQWQKLAERFVYIKRLAQIVFLACQPMLTIQ
jgi:hypothetical protein